MAESEPWRPSHLRPEEARWLHETLEERARHEDRVLSDRATFFIALTTALLAALVLAQTYGGIPNDWTGLGTAVLPGIGAGVSVAWWFIMKRTLAASNLYRQALFDLEGRNELFERGARLLWEPKPPANVSNPDARHPLFLTSPVTLHRVVFRERTPSHWYTAVSPNLFWSDLPIAAGLLWLGIGSGIVLTLPSVPTRWFDGCLLVVFPAIVIGYAMWQGRRALVGKKATSGKQ